MLVAMPQQPLNPFEVLQQLLAFCFVLIADTASVLFEHRDPHGNVKPVEHMLGFRSDSLSRGAYLLAAISQKRDILLACSPCIFSRSKSRRLGFAS